MYSEAKVTLGCLSVVCAPSSSRSGWSPAANGRVSWSPASLSQRVAREPVADDHLQFLVSPEALEVMESLTHSLIVTTDLTDVTLVSDDTY